MFQLVMESVHFCAQKSEDLKNIELNIQWNCNKAYYEQ